MANTVRNYSIGGGVSIAIGLIGAGVQSRWPGKSVGTVLMIAGGVALLITVVAAIARWHTIREYQREHPQVPTAILSQQLTQSANPHNEFKPSNVVNVHVPVSQKRQTQAARERAPSTFEATDNARIVTYGLDGRTGKLINEYYYGTEEDLPHYVTLACVALAQFHYRHESNVEPRLWLCNPPENSDH